MKIINRGLILGLLTMSVLGCQKKEQNQNVAPTSTSQTQVQTTATPVEPGMEKINPAEAEGTSPS